MDTSALEVLARFGSVILLALVNGFFVAAEFALVGARRSRIERLAEAGNRAARLVLKAQDQIQVYVSATQFGITLASLALGWIGEDAMAHLLDALFRRIFAPSTSLVAAHSMAIAIAFAMITYLHIVLGELAPKTLALQRADRVALVVIRPLEVFYRVFKAPIWVLEHSGARLLWVFGLHAKPEHTAAYSEEELRHLIALSYKSGHVLDEERRLIDNVFEFTETTVETVMVPRTEIEALDIELDPLRMLELFEQTRYSRMPVYRDSLDNVIGILLHKDLSRAVRMGGRVDIEPLMRTTLVLPPSVKLHVALRRLRRSTAHMALVVDEHGGVEGLVTLEDLIEEIVGDIRDEHDELAGEIQHLPDGSFRVSGNLSVRDANKSLDLGLPESDAYNTVAGFMLAQAGRLLRSGESVGYNGLRLTVQSASRNRILETKIERVGGVGSSEF
ncbi:MAG TPA: hemolysin family protein [Blastocatellia bacterium]|nr:hemolysin family protein [Blastocatellia bacterium]